MFSISVALQVLLATTAIALPAHHNKPTMPTADRFRSTNLTTANKKNQHLMHPFWSGAIHEADTDSWNHVTATIVVPKITELPNGAGFGDAAAWVGFDAQSCDSGFIHAGIRFFDDGGEAVYKAWYNFEPSDPDSRFFNDFDVNPGDSISVTVSAKSKTKATVSIKNLDTGDNVDETFILDHALLCLQEVDWIVNGWRDDDGNDTPYPNYDEVKFLQASARGYAGYTRPGGGIVYDMVKNGTAVTHATTFGKSVHVKHV